MMKGLKNLFGIGGKTYRIEGEELKEVNEEDLKEWEYTRDDIERGSLNIEEGELIRLIKVKHPEEFKKYLREYKRRERRKELIRRVKESDKENRG